MNEKEKKLVQSLLKNIPEVDLAYLIGSAVSGHQRKDSDLDLALVVNAENFKNFDYGKVHLKVQAVLSDVNLDLRVILPDKTDYVYLYQVAQGKLIYSKTESARIEFEKKAMLHYFDTQHIRDIFHYYLDERIEEGTYGR